MTAATLIDFPTRPEGRPSNAALQMENRTLRAAIDALTEERDELDAELRSWIDERLETAAAFLAFSRRGQVALGNGYSPARQLDDIERLALREQVRARAMRTAPEDAA